jgi:excinuclease ABC subunit B
VAILDADKEGFLRSTRSIVQIAGRAARNVNGRIILYADTVTDSIKKALDESLRRRNKQLAYNAAHGMRPQTVQKRIVERIALYNENDLTAELVEIRENAPKYGMPRGRAGKKERVRKKHRIMELEKEMFTAARNLEFEKAARLRDTIETLRKETT